MSKDNFNFSRQVGYITFKGFMAIHEKILTLVEHGIENNEIPITDNIYKTWKLTDSKNNAPQEVKGFTSKFLKGGKLENFLFQAFFLVLDLC